MEISIWKQHNENNPSININTLNIVVQRILNRIIFLRICEDRSFQMIL